MQLEFFVGPGFGRGEVCVFFSNEKGFKLGYFLASEGQRRQSPDQVLDDFFFILYISVKSAKVKESSLRLLVRFLKSSHSTSIVRL